MFVPSKISVYQTFDGKSPFEEWLRTVRDRKAAAKVKVRIDRVRLGNLGQHRTKISKMPAPIGQTIKIENQTPEGRGTMKPSKSYHKVLIHSLKNPRETAEYVNAAHE